jgi:glycosyltransferase involved in cell wall biosynthesis
MPTISIIMPAFNAAKYIRETIDSILSQSIEDWELLVTDDGSTDQTVEIIQEYITKDARIRLLKNECGKGPAAARNHSVNHATGEYIAFLDSDDLWKPNKLEAQLDFMKERGADFSYTGYNHMSVNGEFLKKIKVPESVDHNTLLTGNVIATATVMLRRSAFPDLEMPDFPRAQDFALWLKLLSQTDQAFGLNEPLSDYRVTPNSGNRRKIFALKYLYDIYTQQEKKTPVGAIMLILRMYLHRVVKYG